MSPPLRRRTPLAILATILTAAVLGLAASLLLIVRANDSNEASARATVAALRTEIAQQAQRIEELRGTVVASPTPVEPASTLRSYLASFQLDKYAYILYLEWDESHGFVRNGRLLTADNYVRKGSKAFQLNGIDNNGSVGFTAKAEGATITFSGKVNADGTFTVSGLPWYVFYGVVGGTFTQTLHAGTLQDYDAAVASLAAPPS